MRFAAWLARQQTPTLARLASALGLGVPRATAPEALRQEIERAAPAAWERCLTELREPEWAAARFLLAWPWPEPPRADSVTALQSRDAGAHAEPLARLIDWGIVLPIVQSPFTVHEMADEALPLLLPRALGVLRGRLEKRVEPPAVTCEPSEQWLSDLYHIAAQARLAPLSVTQAGMVYKRDLKGLEERLHGGGHPVIDRISPNFRTASLINLGLAIGLLRLDRERRRLEVGPVVADFLAAPPAERAQIAWQAWERALLPTDRRSRLLIALLQTAHPDQWIELDSIARLLEDLTRQFLRSCGSPTAVPAHAEGLDALVLHMLMFGLLTAGAEPAWPEPAERFPRTALWLRLTPAGRAFLAGEPLPALPPEGGGFFVQPHFEVLVPPDCPRRVVWELESLADLAQADRASIYRLREASIVRALRSGRSPSDILEFLSAHSLKPLPQNVAYQLSAWCARFGRVVVARAVVLCTKTPELLTELLRHPEIKARAVARLGPCAAALSVPDPKALAARLESLGYPPPADIVELGSPEVAQRFGLDTIRDPINEENCAP